PPPWTRSTAAPLRDGRYQPAMRRPSLARNVTSRYAASGGAPIAVAALWASQMEKPIGARAGGGGLGGGKREKPIGSSVTKIATIPSGTTSARTVQRRHVGAEPSPR